VLSLANCANTNSRRWEESGHGALLATHCCFLISCIVPRSLCSLTPLSQSPGFDPEWETNGYQDAAVDLLVNWVKAQAVPGLTLEVLREKVRTKFPDANSTHTGSPFA
jgi:hypothetical protein